MNIGSMAQCLSRQELVMRARVPCRFRAHTRRHLAAMPQIPRNSKPATEQNGNFHRQRNPEPLQHSKSPCGIERLTGNVPYKMEYMLHHSCSLEAVRIALEEIQREANACAFPLPSIVFLEISNVSSDDCFAALLKSFCRASPCGAAIVAGRCPPIYPP